jgi:hypothetical protein
MEFGLIKQFWNYFYTWIVLCVRIMGTLGYCKLQTIIYSLIKYIKTGKELTFGYLFLKIVRFIKNIYMGYGA